MDVQLFKNGPLQTTLKINKITSLPLQHYEASRRVHLIIEHFKTDTLKILQYNNDISNDDESNGNITLFYVQNVFIISNERVSNSKMIQALP